MVLLKNAYPETDVERNIVKKLLSTQYSRFFDTLRKINRSRCFHQSPRCFM